jgi:hypothetical protein
VNQEKVERQLLDWKAIAAVVGAVIVVLSQILEVIELFRIDNDTTQLISVVEKASALLPKK